MKSVLFDTNIILDVALKRQEHFDAAQKLFGFIDSKQIIAYITATTITDIYYISKKDLGRDKAFELITNLIDVVEIAGVDKQVITNALNADIKDFEDSVQCSASSLNGIEYIISRNKKDFVNCEIEVYTPKEFLELMS